MTLMEKLVEAGYAKEDFFHHCSDLYVYANDTTQQVINDWFQEQNLNKDVFVKTFTDQITGRKMYDVAFQYTPYWEEKAKPLDSVLEEAASRSAELGAKDGFTALGLEI